ncbi:hypothetical protein [Saccharothrix texasensis]|uniref:hypothetical protein n=1 Tax=Saccharothrix texasensis TaxID=103734 RepID=UPI001FE789E8|nr:hypothetical protein [Saccharothrix texasensis]
MTDTSFDVRIYKTDVYKGAKTTTYWVRWSVAGERFKEPFKTSALAESFRSKLNTAAREGQAFDRETGLPLSMMRNTKTSSWFAFACAFVDMKWRDSAPGQRRTIASALLTTTRGRPDGEVLRKTMRVAFNSSRRDGQHSADVAKTLAWLSQNTRPVSDLAKPEVLRSLLADIERKLDGKRAAPDTIRLRRITLGSALDYAVEKELLDVNPVKEVATQKAEERPAPGGPAFGSQPGAGPDGAQGRSRHRADRSQARGVLRGDVLRRSAPRGSVGAPP